MNGACNTHLNICVRVSNVLHLGCIQAITVKHVIFFTRPAGLAKHIYIEREGAEIFTTVLSCS